MGKNNAIKIVLIEDDVATCRDFVEHANIRKDIVFVGITGDSDEGLKLVKDNMAEAIILDLELSYGKGSGFDFLDEFISTNFNIRPIVIVTTRTRNDNIHTMLHTKYNIDALLYKKQEGYGPEMVFRHLLRFREFYHDRGNGAASTIKSVETPAEFEKRVRIKIDAEMSAIGMSPKYRGRKSAEDAIFLLLNKNYGDYDRIFHELAAIYNVHYNNIVRNIQHSINKVWNNTDDIDEVLRRYGAPINKNLGTPTPTEFVYNYTNKIRREL